jgi:hypothetical protein
MSVSAEHVRVTMKVRGAEGAWLAEVVFTNEGEAPAPLYLPNLFPLGKVQNNVFRVVAGDQKVAYTGRYYKRSTPREVDFVMLAPGASLTFTADLSAAYAIPRDPGNRQAHYEAFHGDVGLHGDLWELRSAPVTF